MYSREKAEMRPLQPGWRGMDGADHHYSRKRWPTIKTVWKDVNPITEGITVKKLRAKFNKLKSLTSCFGRANNIGRLCRLGAYLIRSSPLKDVIYIG